MISPLITMKITGFGALNCIFLRDFHGFCRGSTVIVGAQLTRRSIRQVSEAESNIRAGRVSKKLTDLLM